MKSKISYVYVVILLLIFLLGVFFRNIFSDLPSPESLREYTPTLSTKIYDINEELITELYTERRTWIPLSRIPVDLQNAVIAIEDHRFFHHWGISFRGIVRAVIYNILRRRIVAGGSTITQQLTKLSFLTQERTIARKIKELLLALQIEQNFSKQEILEMYLNQIYFGHGAYGVERAAKVYFSKHTEDMNLSECALLAGLIRYPHYYSPFRHPRRAVYRRSTILARMQKLGFISEHEELSTNSELVITKRISVPLYTAPYFVEYIRLLLEPKYGSRTIYHAGWNIYTTLDVRMQQIAERVTEKFLRSFDKIKLREVERQIEEEKKEYKDYETEITTDTPYGIEITTDIPKVQCALLAMDPRTGQIRAMVGGRNFKESQFNRVIQARRQVGSAFKPIIYAAAIEKGYTPVTIIEDTPVVYVNDGKNWQLAAKTTYYLLELDPEVVEDPEKVWVPENYKKEYLGRVLLRRAMELSLNVAAVKTIEEISPITVIDYARKFGIKSRLTNTLSLALGSSDITLFEIVRAFSVFANRGIKTQQYSVICIEDKDDKMIEENTPQEEDVLSPQTSYIISNLLQGVIQNGTGRYARNLNRPCAGKTGTTNDFSDAWFIGYTPELICGVWVGYDDRRTLGEKKSGGAVACPIWTYFMREALEDTSVSYFPEPPEGITLAEVDPNTGLLATKKIPGYIEVFIDGTEPKELAKKYKMQGVAEPAYTDAGENFRIKYKREPVMYGPTDYGMIYEFMTASGEGEFKAQALGSTDYGMFYEFITASDGGEFKTQVSTSDYEMFYEFMTPPDEREFEVEISTDIIGE